MIRTRAYQSRMTGVSTMKKQPCNLLVDRLDMIDNEYEFSTLRHLPYVLLHVGLYFCFVGLLASRMVFAV